MRLLVNAISIREGGPLTVMQSLINAMQPLSAELQITLVTNRRAAAEARMNSRVRIMTLDWPDRSALHLMSYYNRTLPQLCRNADVMLSLTNYLPVLPVPCPAVLLVQHAGHFSDEFGRSVRKSSGYAASLAWHMKRQWVRSSARRAGRLIVQTYAMAKAIASGTCRPRQSIDVIPHGPGLVARADHARGSMGSSPLRIGYVTKHGIQKNISTVLRAIAALVKRGAGVRLILTLDENDPGFRPIAAEISVLGIANHVENLGEASPWEIEGVYDKLDIFIFASTVESFGFPMVEAMARALPTLVADAPVNREITAEAGIPFSPLDAEAIADVIMTLQSNSELYQKMSAASLERAIAFSWDRAAAETLAVLDAARRQSA